MNVPFDVYVILDFEATCQNDRYFPEQEVIEFPLVLVDARTHAVVGEFQRYVRPTRHPTLSRFCTELTGISQATVDAGCSFTTAFHDALIFLKEKGGLENDAMSPSSLHGRSNEKTYCIVTCGDWDLKTMLPNQLRLLRESETKSINSSSSSDSNTLSVTLPRSWQRWCNIKLFMHHLFATPRASTRTTSSTHPHPSRLMFRSIGDILNALGMSFQGRLHSGIDDCRNIAAVVCELLRRGHFPTITTSVATQKETPAATAPVREALRVDWTRDPLKEFAPTPPHTFHASHETHMDKTRDPSPNDDTQRHACATKLANMGERGEEEAIAANEVNKNKRSKMSHDGCTTQMTQRQQEFISRYLSRMLRHDADKQRLAISSNGFVAVSALLQMHPLRQRGVTVADVVEVVRNNDKQRYTLVYRDNACTGDGSSNDINNNNNSELYIAANQGHSLSGVQPDSLRRITQREAPSVVAIHGTSPQAWAAIQACGYLSPMTRQHIHFSAGLPGSSDGVISGMRATASVLLHLDVARALADGVLLWRSANNVILTAGVGATRQLPIKYIAKVEYRHGGRNQAK